MSRVPVIVCVASSLAFTSGIGPRAAHAGDTWTRPLGGVQRLLRTTSSPRWRINALVIDLTAPGISLAATKASQKRRTTSSFAKLVSAQAAINGDFINNGIPAGLAVGGGAQWPNNDDNAAEANLAFDKSNRVELIEQSKKLKFDPAWMWGVVSGRPQVLIDGVVPKSFPDNPYLCPMRHPRTSVGLSKDGKTLILAVVDGRQSFSVGMTCVEVGKLQRELGAYNAINYDGGGSTTMYIAGKGVVNSPSDGSERVVTNHLALFAPKSGTIGTIKGTVHEIADRSQGLGGAEVKVVGEASDTTGANGRYELSVMPGKYTVKVAKSGYVTKTLTQKVAAGQTVTLDIGLEPAAGPTDLDDDGVFDNVDNCPQLANPAQTDTDSDGTGDDCEGDDDDDGVMDEDDNCPLVANPEQQDRDGDRVGDACDSDGFSSADGASAPADGVDLAPSPAAGFDTDAVDSSSGCAYATGSNPSPTGARPGPASAAPLCLVVALLISGRRRSLADRRSSRFRPRSPR